jgi:hypothetical protein
MISERQKLIDYIEKHGEDRSAFSEAWYNDYHQMYIEFLKDTEIFAVTATRTIMAAENPDLSHNEIVAAMMQVVTWP